VELNSVEGDAIKVAVPSATLVGGASWDSGSATGRARLVSSMVRIHRPPTLEASALISAELLGADLQLHPQQRVEVRLPAGVYVFGRSRPKGEERSLDFDVCGPTFSVSNFEQSSDDFERDVKALCWVLTFISGRMVRLARFRVCPIKGPAPLQVFRHCGRSPRRNLPKPRLELPLYALGPYLGRAVSNLETFDCLKLRSVIHLLALARQSIVPEVTGLLCANILEVLRYNYLHSVLIPAGVAKKQRREVVWADSRDRVTFRTVLEHFVARFNLRGWTGDVVSWRNQVVHEGTLPGGGLDACGGKLLRFVDEVVAVLLGFALEPERHR
jgi:hypothetical protein